MFVYSQNIGRFLHKAKRLAKEILAQEVGLRVVGDRFYNDRESASYPLSIVLYNNKKMLGYFDSDFFEIGLHECLMGAREEQLKNLLRHELAHYVTFMTYGNYVQAHGSEFRLFCQERGWGEAVYKATTCLDDGGEVIQSDSSLLRKVQKLMALSTSNNRHEAEQALIKAQQLLLKYNLEPSFSDAEEERIYLKRILKRKREDGQMRAIAKILETFFVNTVYRRSQGFIVLEILGNRVNIEIADYVADFLQRELDQLWKATQKEHPHLKGQVAKNSFYTGLAKGYCHKVQALNQDYSVHALMVIEKKLADAKALVYKRLSSSRSTRSHCSLSAHLGENLGRKLTINPALHDKPSKGYAAIGLL